MYIVIVKFIDKTRKDNSESQYECDWSGVYV
jgi:hypothetical protein